MNARHESVTDEDLGEQSSLLEEADEAAISDLPTFFVEVSVTLEALVADALHGSLQAGEVQELLQDLKEASVPRISGIFDKYQEQPQVSLATCLE